MYCASRKGNVDIVRTLLKCSKIDVNFQVAEHGGTPLHGTLLFIQTETSSGILRRKFRNRGSITVSRSRHQFEKQVGIDCQTRGLFEIQFCTHLHKAQGKEMMDVYKTLDNNGLDKLKKQYPSVIRLEKELGRIQLNQLTTSVQNIGINEKIRRLTNPSQSRCLSLG